MATKRLRGRSWEYVVRRKGLLERPVSLSFATEEEGDAVVAAIEVGLAASVIYPILRDRLTPPLTLARVIEEYQKAVAVSEFDRAAAGGHCTAALPANQHRAGPWVARWLDPGDEARAWLGTGDQPALRWGPGSGDGLGGSPQAASSQSGPRVAQALCHVQRSGSPGAGPAKLTADRGGHPRPAPGYRGRAGRARDSRPRDATGR